MQTDVATALVNFGLFSLSSANHRHLHSFLHDALPISLPPRRSRGPRPGPFDNPRRRRLPGGGPRGGRIPRPHRQDRKSTRLNSSHPSISYAVFCLKKKTSTQNVETCLTVTTPTPIHDS